MALPFNSSFDSYVGFVCVPQSGDTLLYDEAIQASVHNGAPASRVAPCRSFLGRIGTRGHLFEIFSRMPSPNMARAHAREPAKKDKLCNDRLHRRQVYHLHALTSHLCFDTPRPRAVRCPAGLGLRPLSLMPEKFLSTANGELPTRRICQTRLSYLASSHPRLRPALAIKASFGHTSPLSGLATTPGPPYLSRLSHKFGTTGQS
jgi:hypothetical protein